MGRPFPASVVQSAGRLGERRPALSLQFALFLCSRSHCSPIFDFGKKKASYKAALARYEQSRLAYEQRVLEAFRETDDAVIAFRKIRSTAELKSYFQQCCRKYVDLAELQYRGGSINYIEVLDAQRRYFNAQIELSNAVRDENLSLVRLYKALGGGWKD